MLHCNISTSTRHSLIFYFATIIRHRRRQLICSPRMTNWCSNDGFSVTSNFDSCVIQRLIRKPSKVTLSINHRKMWGNYFFFTVCVTFQNLSSIVWGLNSQLISASEKWQKFILPIIWQNTRDFPVFNAEKAEKSNKYKKSASDPAHIDEMIMFVPWSQSQQHIKVSGKRLHCCIAVRAITQWILLWWLENVFRLV